MSILKLAAAPLGSPLLLALILACVGLLLLRGTRRRAGKRLIAAGAIIAYLGSTSLIGNALLSPLERQYPAFDPEQAREVHTIVVLGSGYEPLDHVPVTGALDVDGLPRIVEAVRLALARPGTRLLLSGGAPAGHPPVALGYERLATELGIEPSALTVMDRALNTAEEARDIAAKLGGTPFILVTSAYHMPRAMRLMRLAGANPLPAPTGQIVHAQRAAERFGVIPGSRALRKTETALHEYVGLAAAGLGVDRAP
jgi:uncharacterized SAM-binding protein YcdF (DUF218 family)